MFNFWNFLPFFVSVLIAIYFFINKKYSYWSARGVPGPTPIFPWGYRLMKAFSRPDELEKRWAAMYGRVYGVYTGLLPTLTVVDHELIRQILVKDFHQFVNRRAQRVDHHIMKLNMFSVEDGDWKRIRSIATPAFTSGKLKRMYPAMGKCIDRMICDLKRIAQQENGLLDTKEVMAGFNIDMITSTVFSIETNANQPDQNTNTTVQSPFVYHGLNMFNLNPIKAAMAHAFPRWFLKLFGINSIFPKESLNFFINLCQQIVRKRKANPKTSKQNDLIQLLIDSYINDDELLELNNNNYEGFEASMEFEDKPKAESTQNSKSKTKKSSLTEKELIAQTIQFMIASVESTTSTLAHVLYELALHPQLQERLYKEVCQEAMKELNPDQYFDAVLNRMPYLEACIKETMRKYTPVIRLERRVGDDNVLIGGIPVDKGVLIEVSIVGVHYDPQYYPNPERFDPDRFMPENAQLLVPYTYLPFGAGPRNCFAMRFAYQVMKLSLAAMIRECRFARTTGTPDRLTIQRGNQFMISLPFQLSVSKR